MKPVQFTDRLRLSHQYRRGNQAMDDDTNEKEFFTPTTFALGSTRFESRAVKFLNGFGADADTGHSRLSFNYDRRWIYVYIIPMTYSATPPAFIPLEAEIPFEDIVSSGVRVARGRPNEDGKSIVTLTITTRRPARFYRKIKGKAMMRRATERDFVFSLGPLESTPGRSVQEMKTKGYIIHEGHAGPIDVVSEDAMTVKVNAWLTWQFEFLLDQKERNRFRERILNLRLAGREDGLDLLAHVGESRIRIVQPETIRHVDPNIALSDLVFSTRYLIEGLVSHGICIPSEIRELVQALDKHCSTSELQERVLTALYNEERIRSLASIIQVRSKQLRKRSKTTPIKSTHQIWVYRCMVTPTRICLFPPEQETSNDALRKYNAKINPTVIEADYERPAEGTIARVRRALNSGLNIAGRHYVFLAYGSSSARDHSCWFMAEERGTDFSANNVRKVLGFDQIKDRIIAKFAARMGIPFSATRAITLEINIRSTQPDVTTPDQKFCFTDGVGLCGIKVARAAAKEFGIMSGVDAYPSAIQIRCGGSKGVLAVWPAHCNSYDVRFRPSQIKFETSPKEMRFGLNVVRISQYRKAFLNRQFIILLDYLGVRNDVFLDMFTEAIEGTRGLPERYADGKYTEHDLKLSVGLSEFPLKELAEAKFNQDPMFQDACKVLETKLLTDLKWKARLEIPDSVYLIGIADEADVLKEGEIFCQYHNPVEADKGPVIVSGICAVMRAPSLHPGDIRVVKAVDYPQLRHLKNVIVFSVKGKQPLPNMLSGGDLDGDDYTLIWNKKLLPKIVEVAADYTAPEPLPVPKVTIENVKDFFVAYIQNDILGQVSNAHLAHADRFGPQSIKCLELAHQASVAVDFPKTGVPAVLPMDLRPRQWPTFMGKDLFNISKNNYESKQILGKLFKLVHPEPLFRPSDIRMLPPQMRIDVRLTPYQIPPSVLDDAFKLKEDYDTGVLGLMNRYRVTEAEVVSGIILRNNKRRRGRDGDLKDPIDQNYRALATNVLELADDFLGKRRFKGFLSPRQIYAVAAYHVTYLDSVRALVEERLGRNGNDDDIATPVAMPDDMSSADGGTSTPDSNDTFSAPLGITISPAPMISFPWVFWEDLCSLPNVSLPN